MGRLSARLAATSTNWLLQQGPPHITTEQYIDETTQYTKWMVLFVVDPKRIYRERMIKTRSMHKNAHDASRDETPTPANCELSRIATTSSERILHSQTSRVYTELPDTFLTERWIPAVVAFLATLILVGANTGRLAAITAVVLARLEVAIRVGVGYSCGQREHDEQERCSG